MRVRNNHNKHRAMQENMKVQKKNLVRNLRRIADEIESICPDRLDAIDVTTNWNGPRLSKVTVTDMRYILELTYANQED